MKVQIVDDNGNEAVEDGYYCLWFDQGVVGNGFFDAHSLRCIADKLDELNKPWDEQIQRELGCPNCKEVAVECACARNKCLHCGKPVGNITFTVCDKCWDIKHKKPRLDRVEI